MGQTTTTVHLESDAHKRVLAWVQNAKATIDLLNRRNRSLRRIVLFQAFALLLAFVGLASLASWHVTVAGYAVALCYLPFFARAGK